MTVAELGERMSSRELSEWMAYAAIEPFGEERADLRQALTTAAVHNLHQAQVKRPKWAKPEDYMLFSEKAQPNTAPRGEDAPDAGMLAAKFAAFTGGKRGQA